MDASMKHLVFNLVRRGEEMSLTSLMKRGKTDIVLFFLILLLLNLSPGRVA